MISLHPGMAAVSTPGEQRVTGGSIEFAQWCLLQERSSSPGI